MGSLVQGESPVLMVLRGNPADQVLMGPPVYPEGGERGELMACLDEMETPEPPESTAT